MTRYLASSFFSFAAALAFWMMGKTVQVRGWSPALVLFGLLGFHNACLAMTYLFQRPTPATDRTGLWLAWMAALLPTFGGFPKTIPWPVMAACLAGYGLVFWTLLTLRSRFGMAPADRGLVIHGPYRWIRHPMYLGELVIRGSLVASSPDATRAWLFLPLLVGIQCWRAVREEQILAGYLAYASRTPWRLLPGIW